jgi:hypothetical protein
MTEPDVQKCPRCLTHKLDLEFKVRTHLDADGFPTITSGYKGCKCGALTWSPSSGTYNLRTDVAEAFGIKRAVLRDPKRVAKPVPPKIRRKGKTV